MTPEVTKKPKEEYVRESAFLNFSEEKQERLRKRFWAKVDIKGPNDCWNWKSFLYDHKDGYGGFKYSNSPLRAHRVSWVMHYEIPIKKQLTISHACDNRICCNPGHIFLATQRINMKDAGLKNRHPRDKTTGQYIKFTDPNPT
jgi:HNH endonuclease